MADITRLCSVARCGRKHRARGYCSQHWKWANRRQFYEAPTHAVGSSPRTRPACEVIGCGRPNLAHGLCAGHYSWSRDHDWTRPRHALGSLRVAKPRPPVVPPPPLLERILAKCVLVMVGPQAGCLLWTGHIDRHGYGLVRISGRQRLVHRVVWELKVGTLTPGLELDHGCRAPRCVEVEHLTEVSHADNLRLGFARKRLDVLYA